MARRKSVNFIRDIGVDPRYGSRSIAKLINVIMERGKKSIARGIVYDALEIIERKAGDKDKAIKIFERALEQIRPAIEVRPRRVGGSVYQIPGEVSDRRAESLSHRWLVASSGKRRDKTMGMRLANEILDASEGRGDSVKKRIDVQKMAEANRAFSHYAW